MNNRKFISSYTSIFDAVKDFREKYDANEDAMTAVRREIDKKIDLIKMEYEEKVRKIKWQYEEQIGQIDVDTNNSKNILSAGEQLLIDYSSFNSESIGNVLEKLVSIIEGEEYSFQHHATHNTTDYSTQFNHTTGYPKQYDLEIIVRSNQKKVYYRDKGGTNDTVQQLVQNGEAILLQKASADSSHYNDKTYFYTINYFPDIEWFVSYNNDKFGYIKEFIDEVIEYRFQNNLDDISEAELLSLMYAFISKHVGLIASGSQLSADEKQEKALRLQNK